MGIHTADNHVAALLEAHSEEEFDIFQGLWKEANTYQRVEYMEQEIGHEGIISHEDVGATIGEEMDVIATALGMGLCLNASKEKLICHAGLVSYCKFTPREPEHVVNHKPRGETHTLTFMEDILKLTPRQFEAFIKDLRVFHYHVGGNLDGVRKQLDAVYENAIFDSPLIVRKVSMQWCDDDTPVTREL